MGSVGYKSCKNPNKKFDYLVFNSQDSNKDFKIPDGTKVIFMPLKLGIQVFFTIIFYFN